MGARPRPRRPYGGAPAPMPARHHGPRAPRRATATPPAERESSGPSSPDRSLHLELDQAVHLDRVLHRQLLHDRLDEPRHDDPGGLVLVDPAALEVEELLVADLRHRRLVAD